MTDVSRNNDELIEQPDPVAAFEDVDNAGQSEEVGQAAEEGAQEGPQSDPQPQAGDPAPPESQGSPETPQAGERDVQVPDAGAAGGPGPAPDLGRVPGDEETVVTREGVDRVSDVGQAPENEAGAPIDGRSGLEDPEVGR